MLKLALFTLGLLATMPLVASSQTATLDRQPSKIDRAMLAQKLVPMRKSSKLRTTVILTTPIATTRARKVELSPADRINQQHVDSQTEMNARSSIGANERAIGISGRSRNATD